jgi:threonine dehydrogenase-like Zn-dependent dehydrogenase
MLSLQLIAHKQLEIIDYPLRELELDELLIKITAMEICGTDFHLFTSEAKVDLHVIIGHASAVNLAFNLTKRGGRILVFELNPKNSKVEFNLQEAFYKELSITTSLLNPFTFQRSISLLTSNQINVEKFLTNKMNLSDTQNFFYTERNNNVIKYQFVNQ